jgi:hypothetical protein
MTAEVTAAIITLLGGCFLALCRIMYLAGQMAEKVNSLLLWRAESERAMLQLSTDVANLKGREQIA